MALLLTADGTPVFIPTQGRTRRQSPRPAASKGVLVKHPFGVWMVRYPSGITLKATVQRAKAKGVRAIQDPHTGATLHVVRPSRRRLKIRKIVGKYLLNPYVLGALTGFGLPKILSVSHTVLAGTGIAVGGYFSPQGSYLRKFSIGAGLGAGLQAGLAHSETLSVVAEAGVRVIAAVKPKLGVVGAVAGGILTRGSKLGIVAGAAAGAFGVGAVAEAPTLGRYIHKKLFLKTARALQPYYW